MVGSLVFIPSVSSNHGKVLGKGVTWLCIQCNLLPSGFLSLVWISDESWDGNKPWVSWKNHSSVFVFIPLLAHSLISFGAQNLKTFTAYCVQPEVGGMVVGNPTGGQAWGNSDWPFEERRQFREMGPHLAIRHTPGTSGHLSPDGDRAEYCLSQPVFCFSLWFHVFIFKKK